MPLHLCWKVINAFTQRCQFLCHYFIPDDTDKIKKINLLTSGGATSCKEVESDSGPGDIELHLMRTRSREAAERHREGDTCETEIVYAEINDGLVYSNGTTQLTREARARLRDRYKGSCLHAGMQC